MNPRTLALLSSVVLMAAACLDNDAAPEPGTGWITTELSPSAWVVPDTVTWALRRANFVSPPEGSTMAHAYDPVRKRVVIFGGTADGGKTDNTWEYDGTGWTKMSPATRPPARTEASMAYDPVSGRIIMFGGYSQGEGTSIRGDTWSWDGTNWVQLSPATSPSPRDSHMMVLHKGRNRVMLFGGTPDWGQTQLNELWEWTGSTWSHVSTGGPQGRTGFGFAYDAKRDRLVVYGGYSAMGGNYIRWELWEWDGASWSERTPSAPKPPELNWPAMTYDPVRERVLLFGGYNYGTYDNKLWVWDGTAWSSLSPSFRPNRRSGAMFTFDESRGKAVLFGAADNLTWEWNGAAWDCPSMSPDRRSDYAAVYDGAHRRVLLGGGHDGANFLEDMWTWNGTAWTRSGSLPLPLRGHRMAFDGARGAVVLFGGESTNGVITGTWQNGDYGFEGLSPAHSPEARMSHGMAYDTARGQVVLFGGYDGTAVRDDTWTWDGTDWTLRSPASKPSARARMMMAYDARRERVVLFGGDSNTNDTWEWDGSTWTKRSPAQSPPARYQGTMTYHPGLREIVLFGGDNGSGVLGDTWEYDGTTWRQMTTTLSPAARGAAMAVYDEHHLQLLLFGGWAAAGDHILNDLWEYRHDYPAGAVCTYDEQCVTGYCVDGVCCDGRCGGGDPGDCLACNVAAGAATDGACAPAKKGTVCRASAGGCDTAETCDGAAAPCPADSLSAAGTPCRNSSGPCDLSEVCTGYAAACPGDAKHETGTPCDDGKLTTRHDVCDAAGVCAGVAYTCPPGPCDQSSTPDGDGCATILKKAGAVCDSGNACTVNDTCDERGRCVPGAYICADGGTGDAAVDGGKDAGKPDAAAIDAGGAGDGGTGGPDSGGSTGGGGPPEGGAAAEYATETTGCACATVSL